MINIGDTLEVTVTGVEPYGFFVESQGVRGLILIPYISWDPIAHPSEVASIGDRLQCKVINLPAPRSDDSPAFTASIRELHPELNPWRDPSQYAAGQAFSGTVVRKISYGYFLQHPIGACGLLHIDDLPENYFLGEGDIVSVVVVESDPKRQTLRLKLNDHAT